MASHPETITLEGFRGLNNKLSPETMGEQFLEIASNIDIDAAGKIRLRKGYSQVIAGTACHSLWSDDRDNIFYMDGSILYRVDPTSYATTELATGLDTNLRMDYERIGSRTFMSNGEVSYVYDRNGLRPWGIQVPQAQPLLTSTGGTLTAGTYQVAIAYKASDGRTGGARLASQITVGDNGGIHLFALPTPTDSTVSHIEIYCSTPDGETLYHVATIPAGTTSYDITALYGAMNPVDSQFDYPCPNGNLIATYNGRLYLAKGDVLFYSNAHDYENFKLSSNFVQFEDEITNIMPVEDGVFITADNLYFLEGNGPENFRLREREPVQAVKNTAVKVMGSYVALENIPTGAKWLFTSTKGIMMVGSGGLVINLTERTVMVDRAVEGAAMFRSQNGINQYIGVLKDPSNNRLKLGDTAVATVVRNGITIT